jgi:hypothetical protein
MLAINSSYSFSLQALLASLQLEMEMLMFMGKFGFQGGLGDLLSPSVHKFDYEHIYSGLSAE